jgi:hypothetical protein
MVVLRLRDGDQLEIASFATGEEARLKAQEVVQAVASAEANGSWPDFAGRFLRPDTIVSVDVREESAAMWRGSAVRSRWADETS